MNGHEEPQDLYELLGVARDAPAAEIARAYRRRARMLHPDARPGPAEGFVELEAAYRVLGDPARRAAYDQALRRPGCWPSPAMRAAAPPWPGSRPPWPGSRPPWPGSGPPWPGSGPPWPGSGPPGAALRAGPVQVSPPPGAAAAGDQADARLAALALLLARRLGAGAAREWPW